MTKFECDEVGELKEYVGCKIDWNKEEKWMKLTQPVLLQSFSDEFDIEGGKNPVTPAEAGLILQASETEYVMDAKMQYIYRKGVGKLLHMMRWSRPDTLNSVRELSRFMREGNVKHLKSMHRVMRYCADTADRGLTLKPDQEWDGSQDFEFEIRGVSDSNYATCPNTRRSVSGWTVFLCGAPVAMKSVMQKIVALSVTEAELFSGTQCAQDMLYVMHILDGMKLKVKTPMKLSMDNQGAVDLVNGYSCGGRTKHIEVRQYFLRDLKEQGLVEVEWIPGATNCSDLFTKNLPGATFEKHAKHFVSERKTEGEKPQE